MATIGRRLSAMAVLVLVGLVAWFATGAAQRLPTPKEAVLGLPTSSVVTRGAIVYQNRCARCHPNERGTRESLRGVYNSGAGQRRGTFSSDTLKYSGKVWNEVQLDAFLADPGRDLPGNRMSGVKLTDPEDRRDVIAYLMTLQ